MALKFCILGNVNNPITKEKNKPYSWFVKSYYDGLIHNDHECSLVDYKSNSIDKLKEILLAEKFDFVFTHLTFHRFKKTDDVLTLFNDVKNEVGTKFIHTSGDAKSVDRYMNDISNVFYMAFVNTLPLKHSGQEAWKIPTHYFPYFSLTYDKMGTYTKSLDFGVPVFTGIAGAHVDRAQFIKDLKAIMNIKLIETQSKKDLRDQTLDLSMSSVILGLSTGYDIDGYMDVRPFQYLGAGAIMIMRKFNGMERLIPDDLYFPFHSYGDATVVKNLWERVQELKKSGLESRQEKIFKYMQQNHSSRVRMRRLVKILTQG